jgi:hypothetical protein
MPRRSVSASSLLAHVPFVLLLAVLAPIILPREGVGDTFFFWYAGHLVFAGGSPYDQNAWASAGAEYGAFAQNVISTCTPSPYQPSCLWTYPPTTAFVFAPFGLLNVRDGVYALTMFTYLTTAASVVAVGQWMGARSQTTRALAICSIALSHPFVFDINAGHFEGLGVLGIVLIAVGLTGRRVAPVVVGALLLSLKPHLYVGLAVVVLVLLVARRDWRTLGWSLASVATANGLALLRFPEAPGEIIWRAGQIKDVGWASTSAFASNLFSSPFVGVAIVFGIAALAFAVAVRFAPAERKTDALVAAGAALGLCLSPYAHPYDFLGLAPAFALALALGESIGQPVRAILLVATAGTLAVWSWLAIAGSGIVTALPGTLPVAILALLGVAAWAAQRRTATGFIGIATSAPGSAGSSRP